MKKYFIFIPIIINFPEFWSYSTFLLLKMKFQYNWWLFYFCIFEYIFSLVSLISLFILIYRWFKANFRSSVICWISRIWKFWIKYSICFLPILTNAYILDNSIGIFWFFLFPKDSHMAGSFSRCYQKIF